MKVLMSFCSGFLAALAGVLAVMLVEALFVPHAVKPWIAVCVAGGISIAAAISTWRALPPRVGRALMASLAVAGTMLGTWLSST